MFLLCLIAALSGTPLRQAEAASDLARTLAGFGAGHVMETIDGGVGDDSGETVLKACVDADLASASIMSATVDWLSQPFLPVLSLPGTDGRHRADRTASLPAGSVRRHAWLQCFLF